MHIDTAPINRILDAAAAEGRSSLLEHEVYAILNAAGCRTPRFFVVGPDALAVNGPDLAARLAELGGERVILKIISPQIAHKTDVGGVKKVANTPQAVAEGIAAMLAEVPRRFAGTAELQGVMVAEMMAIEGEGPGAEAIFALRHNREFGPVVTMGVGGVDTELLGEVCKKGLAVVSASLALLDEGGLLRAFQQTLAWRRLAGLTRTGQKLVDAAEVRRVLGALKALAEAFGHDGPGDGWTITELEVNPFAACRGELVALDGLLKFRKRAALPAPRPLGSLDHMLKPASLALIGVSAKGMNMGRIILRNIIKAGFDPARMYVLRPDAKEAAAGPQAGGSEIDGVHCFPTVASLPERVDLLVVAVSADQVPELMEDLAKYDKAVGVILIPGGMAEKAGGETIEARIKQALTSARERGLPLVANGGNCLGIVSKPGKYHTLFIPKNKLPLTEGDQGDVGLISQSGAFMISRMSKLPWLSARYSVSTGNQVDLTIGDYLRHMAGDPEVRTFGVYVEGFKDADGLAFARAVTEVVAAGREVVFYKAGRTAEGKHATSGHTASLAGDYDVCEGILRQAGAHVARNFDEFSDLLKLSAMLGRKQWAGRRIAAMSNAGYEAVGIADALRGEGWTLELAHLAPNTRAVLQKALAARKIDSLVEVRNPLDLTPMADDAAHEDAVRAFLADPGVDAVLCATIPLTPAMATLADGVPEEESIRAPGSLVNRLARLVPTSDKPVVACLDCGVVYDPMAAALDAAGVPTFRSADVALRAIGLYLETRLRRA